jgi:glycyl-tRNA synthetase beta chain
MPDNWPAKARSSPTSASAATQFAPKRRRGGQLNGVAVIKPELLDEVAALVEWPVALAGNFERRFLDVPAEALISTMQDNQRYFPVVDAHGRLLPHFITIANLESRDPAQVRAGNERVIRPRFSDAEFFWNQDRKQPLAARIEALKQVVFQQRLGTWPTRASGCGTGAVHRRTESWQSGLGRTGGAVGQVRSADPDGAGIPGTARDHGPLLRPARSGRPEVAQAQEEQYLPRFAGDRLPATAYRPYLALADRLDT